MYSNGTNWFLYDGNIPAQPTTATAGSTSQIGVGGTLSVSGNEKSGLITLTTGTGSLLAGGLGTITFTGTGYAVAPAVCITPANSNGAVAVALSYVFITSGTSSFNLNVFAGLTPASTYQFYYIVSGQTDKSD